VVDPDNPASLRDENEALRASVAELQSSLRRLQAEHDSLRASEAKLRAIFQAITDVVLVMNREGRYLEIAPTAPDLLYKPSGDLIGKTLHEVMPPKLADMFLSRIRAAIDDKQVERIEYSLPIGDHEVWFSGTILPMSSEVAVVVARDITEQKRITEALHQSIRHEEQLRAHSALLSELHTPLIPVSRDVLVMPLVGALDEQRVERVMQTLLTGVSAHKARVAILDVTGVPRLDAELADALIGAARAVQLLGTQVILTGVRPDVAATLVAIGADLRGVATQSTLESGIAFAMGRSPERLRAQ